MDGEEAVDGKTQKHRVNRTLWTGSTLRTDCPLIADQKAEGSSPPRRTARKPIMQMRGFFDSGTLRLGVRVALVARKQLENKPMREPGDCPHFCARNMQCLCLLPMFGDRRFPYSK